MNEGARRYGGPVALATLVHVLALAGLFYHYTPTADELRRLAPEQVIQAELVAMEMATPTPAPSTPPPPSSSRERDFEPVPNPPEPQETPTLTPDPQPKPKPASRIEDNRQLRELEQKTLDEALDAEAAAVNAAVGQNQVASYYAKINQLVSENWSRPPSARRTMVVWLLIELVPTGEVVNVAVTRSSGDVAFDRSAVDAVRAARRFEVPTDRRLFETAFRRMTFQFTPKDLMR
jgi:colicin import membrane protein